MRVTVVRADRLPPPLLAVIRAARLPSLLRGCGTDLGVAPTAGLAVRLTDDIELAQLNSRFRGVDSPTDVLAFPADEPDHIGDLAISVERAVAQSSDGVAELRLLAVHGLLHCLGHDHAEPAQATEMASLTRRLLPGQVVPDLVVDDQAEPGGAAHH